MKNIFYYKFYNFILNRNNKQEGFTIPELIISGVVSLIVLLAGFSLLRMNLQINKSDEVNLKLGGKVNSALDFIVDEISISQKVISKTSDIPNGCSLPPGELVLALKIPSKHANEKKAYKTNKLVEANQDCPIIYNLVRNNSYRGKGGPYYILQRTGPSLNEKGYYEINNVKTTDVLDKVKNKFGLSLENISFGYVSTQKIIDNLNIFFKKGEIVSISGRSGAGKSTLLDIIMGLIEPDKGLIAFEGSIVNKSKADLIAWQKNISYVPQEIFLIDDDISMNIALGQSKNNIDFKKIQKVIEITDLEDFVKNQKYGLKTRVGERGAKVSGGQKQRIAIARALYKDFNLLILDEATSALDIVSQNKIIGNIKKFYKDKIIIFVSHNDKLIESCDRNYDLKN